MPSYLGLIGAGVAAVFSIGIGLSSCNTVDSGEVGLYKRFGEIQNDTAGPGLHFVNPFSTSIETMSVQTQRFNGSTPLYTADLQTGTAAFSLNYSLQRDAAVRMRRNVGTEWANRLIPQIVESSIKTVFGRTRAAAAIANRGQLQNEVTSLIRAQLQPRGINVEGFTINNVDYSDAFEQSVERAQVATQRAIEAQNATVRITEEGRQRVITAESEARAIQLQAQAITSNPAIVQMRAVEKWDGRLPQNMYGANAVPFIQQR